MDRVLLAHGGGGRLSRELVESLAALLSEDGMDFVDAAAVTGDIVVTTDSFVVKPLFFPGGDIGSLAVHGTVNDLAAAGAEPLGMTVSLIIEEGFPVSDLRKIMTSLGEAARRVGVRVVGGDTKVVGKGEADGVFITTSGVGRRVLDMHPSRITEGDVLLINGDIGRHGAAVIVAREGLPVEAPILSDSAPLWSLVETVARRGVGVHAARDVTRGGLAAVCNELADAAGVTFELHEADIPVDRRIRGLCEMLGLDPLALACEGRMLMVVSQDEADALREAMEEAGERAPSVIGRVVARRRHPVLMKTTWGGERLVEMPYGEIVPRIC